MPGRKPLCDRTALPASIALVLVAGLAATIWVGRHARQSTLDDLAAEAGALARTINPAGARALAFTAEDLENESFRRIRQQMATFARRPGASRLAAARDRFIYSMAWREGRFVFGPESLPEDSPHASPPGTEYLQPPPELGEVLKTRKVISSGPYTDEYGSFLSGFAPVFDPLSGEILLVIGVDEPTAAFEQRAARLRLAPITITVILLAVVGLAWPLLQRRERMGASSPGWLAHVESIATAAVGLTLTAGIVWGINVLKAHAHHVSFRNLAASQSSRVLEQFMAVRDQHLAALSAFVANSDEFTQSEFREFLAPLRQSASLRSYLWAPHVQDPATELVFADRGVADLGAFPVLRVWPPDDSPTLPVDDLTVDPDLRAAINLTIASGLATATRPLASAHGQGSGFELLAFAPVPTADGRGVRGVAAVVVSLEPLLHQALGFTDSDNAPMRIALVHLDPGQPPLCVAARPPQSGAEIEELIANREATAFPVFALNHTFAVVVAPGVDRPAPLPVLIVGLAGFLLTFTVTALVASLVGRRAHLDRELRERTAALRENERTLQAIIDSALNAIVMIDDRGRITLWNPAAERMFGHPRAAVIGLDLHLLLTPERLQTEAERGVQQFRSTGEGPAMGKVVELPALRKGGEEFPIELSLAPVRIGSSWHAVGVISDISERHRIESERRTMERHVIETQKLESLGVLAGGIAHDFNNILMSITARSDAALFKLAANSPARPGILDIKQQARRAADLVRQLLAFSGKGRYVVESLDLAEILADVVPLVRLKLPPAAELRLSIPPALPRTEGDASQLRQLLTNLLLNAAESIGEDGGQVTVSAGVGSFTAEDLCDAQHMLAPAAGTFLWIEVADTGHGMAPQTLRRAFEPFFSTRAFGRGLGLAASLGIARGHHGSLRIESSPGKGTTCRVFLPTA